MIFVFNFKLIFRNLVLCQQSLGIEANEMPKSDKKALYLSLNVSKGSL